MGSKSLYQTWLEFVFPPLCKICKEPSGASLFCEFCWEHCSLPDPEGRCRHCFEEIEEKLCERCRKKASLRFPSAFVFEPTPPALHLISTLLREDPASLAAFAFIQWDRLHAKSPDAVVPLPGARHLAREFAAWGSFFSADILRQSGEEWLLDNSIVEEELSYLLISVDSSYEEIADATDAMMEAFPKKIFVLSLMQPLRNPS
jgi:hypothetical protein